MYSVDFIIPSYRSPLLTECCIRSFECNKGQFDFRYIVVENAADESYRENILNISKNVVWINNESENTIDRNKHAWGNAEAIEIGLQNSNTEYVFICHNDVAACTKNWMHLMFEKVEQGCEMVALRFDNPENERIGALHVSGLLINREIANKVSPYPEWCDDSQSWKLDVGDAYTRHFRDNDLKYYCFRNTHNKNINEKSLQKPYDCVTFDRAVDDNNNVIYMHLGRGSLKEAGHYYKKNNIGQWCDFIDSLTNQGGD